MTITERRYYQIAILFSILLHAALLLITLPHSLGFGNGPGQQMETISAGLMDFSSGEPDNESEAVAPVGLSDQAVEELITQPEPIPQKPEPKLTQPKAVPPAKTVTEPEIKQSAKVTQSKKVEQVKRIEQPKKVEPQKTEAKQQPKPETTKAVKPDAAAPVTNQTAKLQEGKPSGKPGGTGEGTGGPTAGSGNGGKGSGKPRSLGTGENMVAGGLDIKFTYPKNAFNENKEGDVQFRAFFNADGSLEKIEKPQSSGDVRLDNAAAKYLEKTLKFKPNPEKYYVDILIMFRIEKEEPIIKLLHAETRP